MTTTTTTQPIDLVRYNGRLTVTNPATGNHRTFRIRTIMNGKLKGMRTIGLLIGANNESDYRDFAFVQPTGKITIWKRFSGTVFAELATIVERHEWYAAYRGLVYQYSVRCRRCNRELTDPESISIGMGPYCRGEDG